MCHRDKEAQRPDQDGGVSGSRSAKMKPSRWTILPGATEIEWRNIGPAHANV